MFDAVSLVLRNMHLTNPLLRTGSLGSMWIPIAFSAAAAPSLAWWEETWVEMILAAAETPRTCACVDKDVSFVPTLE